MQSSWARAGTCLVAILAGVFVTTALSRLQTTSRNERVRESAGVTAAVAIVPTLVAAWAAWGAGVGGPSALGVAVTYPAVVGALHAGATMQRAGLSAKLAEMENAEHARLAMAAMPQ